MSQFCASGGQSIGASATVPWMKIQGLGLADFIFLKSEGLLRVFSNTTVQKHQFFSAQLSSQSNSHIQTWKTIALTRQTLVSKVMSLLLNILSRLVIIFLPRSRHLLISWLQSPSAVILEPPKMKSDTVSTVSPSLEPDILECEVGLRKHHYEQS